MGKNCYGLGDRFVFWMSLRFGWSIDGLYSRRYVRLAMIVLDRLSGSP